jgi:hypothetical protein
VTPTEHVFSLGIFGDEMDEEHGEGMISWERTCIMGMGRSTLGHDGDV